MIATNKQLLAEFNRLNKKYFGGKLKVIYVKFCKLEEKGAIGHTKAFESMFKTDHWKNWRYAIRISNRCRHMSVLWRSTLIHEMVHLELNLAGFFNHNCGSSRGNTRFNKRMLELAKAGAFNDIW